MMLALLVLSCLAAAVIVAAAVKRHVLHASIAIPLVTLLPLGGWLLFQAGTEIERSPFEFQVLGQHHRLGDTLHIGTDAGADVVLRQGTLPDTRVRLGYVGGVDSVRVVVERSALPVLLGDVPVNALPLDRRAEIVGGDGAVTVVRPWYCLRCDTRILVDGDGARREIRIGASTAVAIGSDTVRLFRSNGSTYAAADPASGVTVDGAAIPQELVGAADSLQFGVPALDRLDVVANAAEHRIDVLFARVASSRSWTLPVSDADTLRLLVASTNGHAVPGTMPVINPASVAPGAGTEPYGGVLRQQGTQWEWVSGGVTRGFAVDAAERLPDPGDGRTRGHIVRLRQHDTDPGAARFAVIAAWIAGVLVLAWSMRLLHPEALALRVLLLGAIYTLVAVRGTLAFRAWLAPPHDATSPVTFIALLFALPALAALFQGWSAPVRRPRELAFMAAPLVLAAAVAAFLVLPEWRLDILRAAGGAAVAGALGLVLLNRLLFAGSRNAQEMHPVAAVTVATQEGYTYRQFMHALVLLAVFAVLLLIITELVKFGTLLALLGWGVILAVVLLATSGPRALIQPRGRERGMFIAGAAALASGALAFVLGRGVIVALLAMTVAGAAAWALAARPSVRLRPVHLRDLVGPPLTLALGVALVAVLVPGLVSATRVLAEYALAIAGLIVIARIFAILWFRHTQGIATRMRSAAARAHAPHIAAIGIVLMLLAAAIYTPLALFDTGLVLLFFAATVTVVFAGFWMIGARALGGLVAVGVVAAFLLGMFVGEGALLDGSADLSTARIRYAATYHPDALQRHMLLTDEGRPITVVRTLQQYWGMRHFAAAGTTGRGYFNADYADWIVPRPVALTENVFSTFLLSEHGWVGGVAVLLCYLSIALALLYGAWRACARVNSAPRALLLVGVGAFWLVPAFYIAAANGLLLPLTGQNMPMLGLLSSADVALASWLGALGLAALPVESESGSEHVRSGGWTQRLRRAVLILSLVFTGTAALLAALLWRPLHAEVGDFTLDRVVSDVEALVDQGALTVADAAPDTIAVAPSAARHPFLRADGFLRSRVARSNAITRGEGAGAGCLDSDALVRPRDDGGIAVFGAMCSLRAVVEGRRDWHGALVADAAAAEFAVTDGRTTVLLDPGSAAAASIGAGCSVSGIAYAQSVRIGCGADAPRLGFGTTAPVLEDAGSGVSLNGDVAAAPTLLRDRDHLHVGDGIDAWVVQVPHGALSYPRWENGVTRRVHDARLEPWLAQVDTQLARGLSNPERAEWNATVTLRPAVQRRLQEALADACAAAPGVRRCSAVLADPFTGEVLAFTSTFAQPHRYLSSDPNLRNHPAASSIKPIMAAAAVHAFPELRTLQVQHDASVYDVIANVPLQPPVRAARIYPSPLVPWTGFLGASDNVYAITLGFLAAGEGTQLTGSAAGSRMLVEGRPLRGQPSWAARGSGDLSGSPFARSLDALFDVHADAREAPPYDRAYWQSAVDAGAIVASGDVQRITPEPVALGLNIMTTPRRFASFLLGGGHNRWNNVSLVQAFSRIFTGRAVQLHVLRSVGETTLAAEPAPIDGFDVARGAVIDGLDAVISETWGTGNSLRGSFPPKVFWRAKTGTLQEQEWNGSVFLFAGSAAEGAAGVCAAAGIVTLEMIGNASPDGRATTMFREAIAPLLRDELGWGGAGCR